MPIVNKHGVRAAGLQVRTRRQEADRLAKAGENTQDKIDKRLLSVVSELVKGLSENVYSNEGKKVIENTRTILDWPALALKLKETGASPIKVSVTEFPRFKKAIESIPITSLKDVPVDELKIQHRAFVEKPGELTAKKSEKDLYADAKDIIKQFFDPAA